MAANGFAMEVCVHMHKFVVLSGKMMRASCVQDHDVDAEEGEVQID